MQFHHQFYRTFTILVRICACCISIYSNAVQKIPSGVIGTEENFHVHFKTSQVVGMDSEEQPNSPRFHHCDVISEVGRPSVKNASFTEIQPIVSFLKNFKVYHTF